MSGRAIYDPTSGRCLWKSTSVSPGRALYGNAFFPIVNDQYALANGGTQTIQGVPSEAALETRKDEAIALLDEAEWSIFNYSLTPEVRLASVIAGVYDYSYGTAAIYGGGWARFTIPLALRGLISTIRVVLNISCLSSMPSGGQLGSYEYDMRRSRLKIRGFATGSVDSYPTPALLREVLADEDGDFFIRASFYSGQVTVGIPPASLAAINALASEFVYIWMMPDRDSIPYPLLQDSFAVHWDALSYHVIGPITLAVR